ncbi:probable serine/threonine-protein kinase DDB_G0291350 isoform X2 [Durio zibethinus]|uniref:Probable serine/threonine-protein kinase DDB_G0291350 isoform X2 n=1 Tax=Durio zibethinus TaxID=66656 RepID=A0A6P5X791_DURZI|nr:probable serine/threonine-protein kinase DDB_G0291350 isoform X2 [Durio zibethinus]
MEGVGARLGRSSTRYGPATVFTGPVRKWKKKWVHVSPSNSGSSNNNHSQNHHSSNGTSNGNNGSHLVLFKWTPISQSQNNNNNNNDNNNGNNKDDAVAEPEEPPRRKFKYIPIAVLEEQKKEAAENLDDEAKPSETDPNAAEPTSRNDDFDEKPDINDVPMEESEFSVSGG